MPPNSQKQGRVIKEAFECRSQLLAYARSLLGDYSAAEDAVQEAMLVVVKKYEQFEEGTSMLAWCRSMVRYEVLRINQKRKRERTLTQRLLGDAIDAAYDEFQTERRKMREDDSKKALATCLEKVSPRGRDVLRCRFVDGLSYEKIGTSVDMKLEAVRKTLFRVKKQLKSCVDKQLRELQ